MKIRGVGYHHFTLMTDYTQKQPEPRGIRGSLASRVLTVALTMLVIPLFIYSVVSFTRDYREEFEDLFLSIRILGDSRAKILDQFNHLEYRFLDMTQQLLELKAKEPGTAPGQLNAFLNQIRDEQDVSSIFYLERRPGDHWVCTISSNPQLLGKDFSSYVDGYSLSEEHRATIRWDPEKQNGYYLVSKRIYSPDTAMITGMLNIALTNELMMQRIEIIRKSRDPTQVSILDPSGMVFLSTEKNMVFNQVIIEGKPKQVLRGGPPKSVVTLKPYISKASDADNDYTFEFGNREEYGALVPIEGSNLELLVAVPEYTVFQHFESHLYDLAIFMGIVIFVGGIGTFWLTRRMAKPFNTLCKTMIKVEQGDLEARFSEQKMGFEINVIGKIFNEMIGSLLSHMRQSENERVAKETLSRELLIGQEVQKSILPKQVPAFSNLEIASGFLSAKEVGGDFYDLFTVQRQDDDHLMCAVADTAGKGISACFYSLGLRSILRSYAAVTNDLGKLLTQSNNAFCHDTGDSGVFVTAWVAFIDEKNKKMVYSSCGHPPSLLKRKDGPIEKLTTPGIALGVNHLDHVSTSEVQLNSGDVLMLYSDGIIEAHSTSKELYGEQRLIQFFEAHACDDAQKVVNDLLTDVGRFTTGAAQFDDVTILVVKVL
ncbi:MAG TPA: SpoIIE family protein phosphatase [Chlamydiales bacterium]|nr:SpoIIE family protein phosphatase [Chlamydiales bacterium]HPE84597.1 SpoIIE family protein phosphatase [Chlamydiales bacterium]